MFDKLRNVLGARERRLQPKSWWPESHEEMRRLWERSHQTDQLPIIVDVGAYDGSEAKHFRKIFPEATVYAFEPFSSSFSQLTANVAADKCIKPFNMGLSNRNGLFNFHANSFSATNSLLPSAVTSGETWGQDAPKTESILETSFKTLDTIMQELGIPYVTILKLDVQGAEYLVLEGANQACQSGKIDMIYTEIIIQPTYEGQKRFDQALAIFYDAGFDLHNVFNLNLKKDGRLRQLDAIFTRR